ncbi:MAG TPA: thioredoxin [Oscillospiraceae bacterium]|nr:thioredoxin [Oscillospiraceae bacterium]
MSNKQTTKNKEMDFMSTVKITKENFNAEVMNSDRPVLIDFWAPWCGPCRMVSPIVDEIADEVSATVKVGKINIDEEPELASSFNVMSIPTLVVVKNGKIVNSAVGARPKQEILKLLNV